MTNPLTPDLASYDVILVNTSAGKDSQVALDVTIAAAEAAGVRDRVVAVHCDLGRVEWEGTRALAERQVRDNYPDIPFVIVTRPQGDLLHQVETWVHPDGRRYWPSSAQRFCTSDHKTSQVRKLMTALVKLWRAEHPDERRQVRILDVLGIRAEESPQRAKKVPFSHNRAASNGKRHIDTWFPVFTWSTEEIWEHIERSGVEHHWVYDEGLPRLSCAFCVMAGKGALVRAAQLNPDLAAEYARVESEIGHRFQNNLSMAEIIEAAETEVVVEIGTWEC